MQNKELQRRPRGPGRLCSGQELINRARVDKIEDGTVYARFLGPDAVDQEKKGKGPLTSKVFLGCGPTRAGGIRDHIPVKQGRGGENMEVLTESRPSVLRLGQNTREAPDPSPISFTLQCLGSPYYQNATKGSQTH